MGYVKANAALSAKISCESRHEHFLENMERPVSVWVEDEAEEDLSVSGAGFEAVVQPLHGVFCLKT